MSPFPGVASGPESSIMVLVPSVERLVGAWRARFDPLAPIGVPAHVTVLYPFLPPHEIDDDVTNELRRVLGSFEPFAFALARTQRFPGVLYLAPEPADPFIAMTRALAARWPQAPPYGGRFDTVVPHLTVAHADDEIILDEIERTVSSRLPFQATASGAWLLVQDDGGRWWVRSRFALGS